MGNDIDILFDVDRESKHIIFCIVTDKNVHTKTLLTRLNKIQKYEVGVNDDEKSSKVVCLIPFNKISTDEDISYIVIKTMTKILSEVTEHIKKLN